MINILLAASENNVIGKDNKIPWYLPADLRYFKKLTAEHVVIMGRKTWESLPPQFRPLPGRINLVLSRQPGLKLPSSVLKAESLDKSLERLSQKPFRDSIDRIFVIGGEQIFREAIVHSACHKLYLTHILRSFDCDCFFPQEKLSLYKPTQKSKSAFDGSVEYFFGEYTRV